MKYVIWGCGARGKRVVRMLGETQRVAAIVESNKDLHGSMYCGIPIISFDEFLLSYSAHPVIVASRFFEDEIIGELKRKNIIGVFPLSRDVAQIDGLLLQLPISQTLKRYKDDDNLAIYGVSILGLILYDIFFEAGFEVSLVIPSNTSSLLRKYIKETLKLKTISVNDVKNNMKLLLADKLEANDQKELHGAVYDTYYDLHLQEELFYRPEIEKFQNIHKGKRCFIVATGASLRMDDLDTLHRNGEICISVNGIFKAFDQTKWRPNYYVVSDLNVDKWKNEILEIDAEAKFVADVIYCFNDKHYDNIYKWHIIRGVSDLDQELPNFSDDFARGGYWGHTVVYDGALQLAAYMGFTEIYLLGTDCTVSSDGKTPHFVSNYHADPGSLMLDYIMLAYQAAKQYADSHGIKIYNATRGGELEIFPRADFDSLFN